MTVTRPLQSDMAAWDGFFAARESGKGVRRHRRNQQMQREKEKQRNYDYHIKRRVKERI